MWTKVLPGAALACVLMPLASASAAGATGGDEDERQARALFERAERSFDVGRFSEALADYRAAYQRRPLPAFLFNIAQCHRNMGSFERARFFFQRYLIADPKAANRPAVESLIEEMTRLISKQGDDLTPARAGAARPGSSPVLVLPPSRLESLGEGLPPSPAPPSATAETVQPVYRRWWFWSGIAVVAAGAAGWLATREPMPAPAPGGNGPKGK